MQELHDLRDGVGPSRYGGIGGGGDVCSTVLAGYGGTIQRRTKHLDRLQKGNIKKRRLEMDGPLEEVTIHQLGSVS